MNYELWKPKQNQDLLEFWKSRLPISAPAPNSK